MRIILTQSVPKLGEVGDVCDVAAGYGRNYLLPQRLAILATPGALRQVDDLKRTEQRRQDKVRYDMTHLATRIGALRLPFTARVGETGRLYGSITAADIAAAIEARLGEPIDRRKILLDESIRTLGDHTVPIHLMPGVDAQVVVEVVPDAEPIPDRPLPMNGDAAPAMAMAADEAALAEAAEPSEVALVPEAETSPSEGGEPEPGDHAD